jgi:hypothetical protein
VFVAWRGPEDKPFMTAAVRAAAPILQNLPAPEPDAPGQFAFANADRVRRILAASGWSDVEILALDVPCTLAEGELAAYATKLGPVGRALLEADEATRARTTEAVRAAFAPYVHDGVAQYDAACWLVRAKPA